MLNESVAIITGGASGLGLSIANKLHEQSVKVIVFDKNESALNQLPNHFIPYRVDVTDYDVAITAIRDVIKTYGKINILVNNAGQIYNKTLINVMHKSERVHDYDLYKDIIDINMNSVFLMTSLVAEQMILKRTPGVIINISSVCAHGNAGQSAYSAAKAGVNAFTKSWAKELGAFGIRVAAIAPGFINTESTRQALDAGVIDDLTQRVPLRKFGHESDVANLVLAAITNDYISGAVLDVNGGFSL